MGFGEGSALGRAPPETSLRGWGAEAGGGAAALPAARLSAPARAAIIESSPLPAPMSRTCTSPADTRTRGQTRTKPSVDEATLPEAQTSPRAVRGLRRRAMGFPPPAPLRARHRATCRRIAASYARALPSSAIVEKSACARAFRCQSTDLVVDARIMGKNRQEEV